MLVTDIEITNHQYCQHTARHLANVGVTVKNQFITLFCRIDLPQDEAATSRAAAFVNEAIRQLRRMPEFRSGRDALHFADELAPALRGIAG